MKRIWLFGVLLLLAACVPQAARPQPPSVELVQFGLLSLDPFSGRAEFDLRLKLTNGNSFGLPLLNSTVTAELGGTQFQMTLPAVDLPSGQPKEVQTRLVVPVVDGTRVLASLVSGQPNRFRLLGELKVQLGPAVVPVGPVVFVDRNVQISLSFTAPALKLTGIRLDGLSLVFGLEASNSNPIGFTLQGPLRVSIGGREVGQAALNLNLAPGAKSQGEFRLQLTGLPGFGGLSVNADVRATIPGILDRSVGQILEAALR